MKGLGIDSNILLGFRPSSSDDSIYGMAAEEAELRVERNAAAGLGNNLGQLLKLDLALSRLPETNGRSIDTFVDLSLVGLVL